MGLDMYLNRKTYVWGEKRKNLKLEGIEGIDPALISNITEEIGYWRKANSIHKWFVDNVQNGIDDCGEYYVPQDKLKKLLLEVKQALTNKKVAREILPTQSGFFFGNTDYDKWYFKDLEDTKKILEMAIAQEGDYYYHSSW